MPVRRTPVRKRLVIAAVSLVLIAAVLVGVRYWPREPLSASIPSSTAIFDRDGRLLRLTLARDEQYRLWTPIDSISPQLIDALLLHEDRHFYRHFGVDPLAIVRAAGSTYFGGPRIGGSTITMQLARLKYRLNTRTVGGKLRQMLHAVQLELCYSKRDLLEAHLNLMPYGGNIQGVGAASLIYFDKQAHEIDLAEALSLVLIPQSPARRAPGVKNTAEPPDLMAARARLYERWRDEGYAADPADYVTQPLQFRSVANLPFEAPHFVQSVLNEHRLRGGSQLPRTSLSLPMQRRVERVLRGYVDAQRTIGIRNAAGLVVDYRDMSVRAMVGSADFHAADIHGQVNGTAAKRSPGSALKPFIYALAIDQGVIHPLTVVKDAPTAFGPFSPENFDGQFAGPITATEALTRSRNVPAVVLSSQLANPNFYQFLKATGISRMASEQHYGLALALGGGEVTMQETAMLYAMLANRGELAPLNLFVDQQRARGPRLLSEEASFMTLDMLRSAPRPGEMEPRKAANLLPAWKTGTSWGFRDAWTAGVFGPYVIVVWVGNFDGSGNPAFVGVQAAAPLFFRIVDAIAASEPRLYEPAFRQPPRLERVEVCAASGDLPNADCPRTALTWYIPGVSPIRVSDVHRRVYIDTRTGRQACPPYDPEYTRSEVFEFWPSDLMQLFERAGMPRRRPPAAGECQRDTPLGKPPLITSPVIAATYTIRATATDDEDTIPLTAHTDTDVQRVHWFVDEAYVGTSAPSTPLAWKPPRGGRYLVRAIDDRGRADTRAVEVELLR